MRRISQVLLWAGVVSPNDLGVAPPQLLGPHPLQGGDFPVNVQLHALLLSRRLGYGQPDWTLSTVSPGSSRQFGSV